MVRKEHLIKDPTGLKLFHLSFSKQTSSIWKPRLPDGTELVPEGSEDLGEPSIPRISFSPTLEQCFRAIWPNIDQYFKIKKYPYLEFYVYTPILTPSNKVVPPNVLLDERWVWDAHITYEHWVLNPVKMHLLGKCRVKNTLSSGLLMTRIFNDPKEPIDSDVGPKQLEVETLFALGLEGFPVSAKW